MVSVRYRTHDVIITVGSVWDNQHGNQSGTTKSDVRIDSTVREEMAAQARQVRPPLLSHTILTRETGTRIHTYYFEKIPKNGTGALRTESKETPDRDQQRTQQGFTQSNPRYPILNTKKQGFGETPPHPPLVHAYSGTYVRRR